ncbi:hypothetical protein P3S67_000200 [Capsicum chacoense]
MESSLWSDCLPTDILGLISSRLVGGEYFVFRAVCKRWRTAPLKPPHPSLRVHDDDSPSPYLVTLRQKTGTVEFFHPMYNEVTHKKNIAILKGCRIRSAKGSWLLMSQGNHGMFFFNPHSNDIVELPNLPEQIGNYCCAWTFSSPPDSLDCFVVGFDFYGSPPLVCIIKVGDSTWKFHRPFNTQERFQLTGCNNPVFFEKNSVYVWGDEGNLGILNINENSSPTWEFYGKPFPSQKLSLIRKVYTAEDVDKGGMLVVFLTHEEGKVEVWRYKMMNESALEREQITNLDDKTLFVTSGACCLKSCVAHGLKKQDIFSNVSR